MATPKQIEANRRNALRSTGPRTDDGKDRSRRNALTHGLSGTGVVLPDGEAEAVRGRMADWHSSLRPFDAYQTWLLEVVAVESLRVERCRDRERAIRAEAALRAEESWDEDRRREAEEVAAGRGRDQALAFVRLRSSAAGCRLLLGWWVALGRALEAGGWDAAQEALALDLLGVPAGLRSGAASPLEAGPGRDGPAHRRGIVAEEAGRLQRLIAGVMADRDDRERRAVVSGFAIDEGRELGRPRRYEGACLRRLQWARAQMRRPGDRPVEVQRAGPGGPGTSSGSMSRDETDPIRGASEVATGDETNPIRGEDGADPRDETNPVRGDETNPMPRADDADTGDGAATILGGPSARAGDETNPGPGADGPMSRDETNPIPGVDGAGAGDETNPIRGVGRGVRPPGPSKPGDETNPISRARGGSAGDETTPTSAHGLKLSLGLGRLSDAEISGMFLRNAVRGIQRLRAAEAVGREDAAGGSRWR